MRLSAPRRRLGAALAALAVAAVVVSGCGAKDDGGVITPANTTNTTTMSPRARS